MSGTPGQIAGFFGREAELERLKALFAEAMEGTTRSTLITGEAGIGKTRLVTELCRQVAQKAHAHWVRCYQGQPPFWCWTHLLRKMGASDHVSLDLRRSAVEPDAARHFDALVALVDAVATVAVEHPCVLVLDDIQLADEASLGAHAFLSREMRSRRVLVLATYRDREVRRGHPLSETLGQLAREELAVRLRLTGLTLENIEPLLDHVAGLKSSAVAESLHARTGGNPLFLNEFGKLAASEGTFQVHSLPEAVADVIGLRLNKIEPPTIELLQAGAVIGETFSSERLQQVMGEPDADKLLVAGVESGIIATANDIHGYAFTHGLIRETLLAELTPFARAQLHGRVADAIESESGTSDDQAAELATHLESAGGLVAAPRLVMAASRAGHAALHANAPDEAEHWFRLAIGAQPETQRDEQRADIAFGLARAIKSAQFEDLGRLATEAFQIYTELGLGEQALRVAAYPYEPGWGDRATWLADLADQALSRVTQDSPWWAWLILQRERMKIVYRGDKNAPGLDTTVLERLLEQARAHQDRPLQIWVLRNLVMYLSGYGKAAWEVRDFAKNAVLSFELLAAITYDEWRDGRDAEVIKLAPDTIELAMRVSGPNAPRVLHDLADWFLARGDWAVAERCASALEDMNLGVRAEYGRAVIDCEHGMVDSALARMSTFLSEPTLADRGRAWISFLAAQTAVVISLLRLQTGQPFFDDYVEEVVANLRPKSRWTVLDNALWFASGLQAVARGDARAAGDAYDWISGNTSGDQFGMRSRILGLVAAAAGRREEAVVLLDSAVQDLDRLGRAAHAAWARLHLALLLEAGERRASLLGEAGAAAHNLGMAVLRRRIDEAEPVALLAPAGLSRRELEVLRMLAGGSPNKEIAGHLAIADKTVESHVRNIYRKIRAGSRAEAATWALRHGVL